MGFRLLLPAVVLLVVAGGIIARGPGVRAAPHSADAAACERLAASWKPRFLQEKMNWVVAPPFVLAGDGTAEQLARYRDGTVMAAARSLKATYFKADPSTPILILLFEDGANYGRLTKTWLGDEDVPHFGYFRRTDHVMVMNVGTGTGTLVHELTHALIEPDFPRVPDWFNEGLASLYEQCSLGTGTITGLPNWRLPALQQAIRERKLRSLEALIKDGDFYKDDLKGINYAQARYLMLYLQQKGLLARYYRQFRDGAAADSTGLATLKKLVAPKSVPQFEKDWRAWVLTLRFEG